MRNRNIEYQRKFYAEHRKSQREELIEGICRVLKRQPKTNRQLQLILNKTWASIDHSLNANLHRVELVDGLWRLKECTGTPTNGQCSAD